MVDETRFESFEAKNDDEPDLDDRERMTERALAAIRQAGPAAALEKCRALADLINAELLQREKIEPRAVADLQAYLDEQSLRLRQSGYRCSPQARGGAQACSGCRRCHRRPGCEGRGSLGPLYPRLRLVAQPLPRVQKSSFQQISASLEKVPPELLVITDLGARLR
jgi:hypothetical protein